MTDPIARLRGLLAASDECAKSCAQSVMALNNLLVDSHKANTQQSIRAAERDKDDCFADMDMAGEDLLSAVRSHLAALLDVAACAREESSRHADSSNNDCPCSLCAALKRLAERGET